MDVIELLPHLHLLRFPVGQAYLWHDGDESTLIDAGPAGSAAPIAAWRRGAYDGSCSPTSTRTTWAGRASWPR